MYVCRLCMYICIDVCMYTHIHTHVCVCVFSNIPKPLQCSVSEVTVFLKMIQTVNDI